MGCGGERSLESSTGSTTDSVDYVRDLATLKTFRSPFIHPTCELSKRTRFRYDIPSPASDVYRAIYVRRAILLLANHVYVWRIYLLVETNRRESLKLLSILSIRFYNWKLERRETLMNSSQYSSDDRCRWRIFPWSIFSTVFFFFFFHQLRHVSFYYSRDTIEQ